VTRVLLSATLAPFRASNTKETGTMVEVDSQRRGQRSEKAEKAIDEVLVETFPASDPPPWTLGLERESAYLEKSDDRERTQSKRGSTG
jgi:hypothetical protein